MACRQFGALGVLLRLLVGEDSPASGCLRRVDIPVEVLLARRDPGVADPDLAAQHGSGINRALWSTLATADLVRKWTPRVVDATGSLKGSLKKRARSRPGAG